MSNRQAHPSTTSGDENVEMIEIFTTPNFAEAEIITDIFDEEDIAYIVHNMEERAFPTTVAGHDQIRIAVEESRAKDARGLIQQALVDEALPGDGNFMDGD